MPASKLVRFQRAAAAQRLVHARLARAFQGWAELWRARERLRATSLAISENHLARTRQEAFAAWLELWRAREQAMLDEDTAHQHARVQLVKRYLRAWRRWARDGYVTALPRRSNNSGGSSGGIGAFGGGADGHGGGASFKIVGPGALLVRGACRHVADTLRARVALETLRKRQALRHLKRHAQRALVDKDSRARLEMWRQREALAALAENVARVRRDAVLRRAALMFSAKKQGAIL